MKSFVNRDIGEHLADYVADLTYDRLDEAAISAAKLFLLDTLACAIAGWDAAGCGDVHAMVADWGGKAESSVWVRGTKLPAPHAALANGMMCHAREFDDVHDRGHVHCLAPVLPAVLAIAERQGGVTGREFLTALTLGVDIMSRLGIAIEVEKGWHYTLTFGVFGAAAASGKILGLDRGRILNALGIAFSHAGGTEQCGVEASLTKRVHPGFAAQAGVTAALMADRGITGPSQIFEGTLGYFRVHENGIYVRERVLDKLGQQFEIAELRVKPYPACGYTHAPLDAIFKLIETEKLVSDQIESIEVAVCEVAKHLVGAPFEIRRNPVTDAQFSLPYQVAAAIRHRRLFLEQFEPAMILDEGTRALADKVSVVVDPAIPPRAAAPAYVQVKLNNGRILKASALNTRGHRQNPLSRQEFEEKYRGCFAYAQLPVFAARAVKLQEMIDRIEELDDMRKMVKLLVP